MLKYSKPQFIYEYNKMNNEFHDSLIYHVGENAGLFSELNNMLIAMCWCYINKVKFVLYADDANFTGGQGWEELFVPFCEINHNKLNRYANYRRKSHFRYKRIQLPNLIFRRFFLPNLLKKQTGAKYLTQDVFPIITSKQFLNSHIEWNLFGINGSVEKEFVKLRDLAICYNSNVFQEIKRNISSLNLPACYYSMQIRGGDKIQEYSTLYDATYLCKKVLSIKNDIKDLFLFTDDYRNFSIVKKMMNCNVYTLAKEYERGYYNTSFNLIPWNNRKSDIIKVLSMMELCIGSKMHFGYTGACTNDFLSSVRDENCYFNMLGTEAIDARRKKNIGFYLHKFFQFK